MDTVRVGAWWAACCVEDLYPIESAADVAEVTDWLSPDEPSSARVWETLAAALADPDISAQIDRGDYSLKTAERLGLPHPSQSR